MKNKNAIYYTAVSSIISALLTILIILGSAFEMLDIVFASVASLAIHICNTVLGVKRAILIYLVSACLSFMFMPMRTCSILYMMFFGYYPIIRAYMYKKVRNKKFAVLFLGIIYNIFMILIYAFFKEIFGIANEPELILYVLLITANVFFFAFELLMGRIIILYNYKVKKIYKKNTKN